jgi:hypothetical protein
VVDDWLIVTSRVGSGGFACRIRSDMKTAYKPRGFCPRLMKLLLTAEIHFRPDCFAWLLPEARNYDRPIYSRKRFLPIYQLYSPRKTG